MRHLTREFSLFYKFSLSTCCESDMEMLDTNGEDSLNELIIDERHPTYRAKSSFEWPSTITGLD